ncbi:MAG: helix-turn-helix transcriptional regulator [Candidatus Omnitrophica bacterium]|nr:helix-turn-helix transcriptional regulator [Candidatus Omnitrophota bacterium]MDE2214701.1 helix-turn-helix transcriptional regulator [Candidatus Omnitrophota bacterium]
MKLSIYSKDHRRLIEKIKTARTEAGMDQKQAARLLGTTQSNISKIESGQRRVDVLQLKELARVYKKRVSYFIEEE